MSKEDMIVRLAEIIKDYRKGAVQPMSPEHVARWLEQFPAPAQLQIISEMVHIFDRRYVTEERFRAFLHDVASSNKLCGNDIKEFWTNASLLNLSDRGSSQREMLGILKEEVVRAAGVELRENVVSDRYVYIDDFIFSGSSLIGNFNKWLETAPVVAKVDFVYIGWYMFGEYHVNKTLSEAIKKSGKNIELKFWYYGDFRLENRLRYKDTSDVLWPTASVLDDASVATYVAGLKREPNYRTPGSNAVTFSSEENRQVLEKNFLTAGIAIRNNNPGASKVLKPLGFSTFEGFGFGAMVFSFRNCPNNCPLAIWWGSRDINIANGWYPLLERYTYEQQEIRKLFGG